MQRGVGCRLRLGIDRHGAMPADAPRSLGLPETADILAYMLSLNKCPAGEKELSPDMVALSEIRITRPAAGVASTSDMDAKRSVYVLQSETEARQRSSRGESP